MEQQSSTNQAQAGQNNPQGSNNIKTSGIAVAVLLALIAVYVFSQKKDSEQVKPSLPQGGGESGTIVDQNAEEEREEEERESGAPSVSESTNTNVSATEGGASVEPHRSSYRDGVYTAVGDYVSPGGAESIGVTLTLKDGVVVDSVIQTMATRPISLKLQELVRDEHKTFVVGKPLDEVKLDKVSSSSLTPQGFNNALEKIKRQAAS